jgi:predicted ATPase
MFVFWLSYFARVLGVLGYPDQALKKIHEALTLARQTTYPFPLAWALTFAATLSQLRGEVQKAQEQAEAVIALSTKYGFPHWLAWATILRGWVLTKQGQVDEGIAQIRQGLTAWQATGAELGRSHFIALLTEAYRQTRQTEEGLSVLTEALAAVDKTGERFYEAELYRLKGELTLAQSSVQGLASRVQKKQKSRVDIPQSAFRNPHSEAEACFLKAIEIARKQQAKLWELRATMSLARLWQQQGKKKQARQMLAEIYGWFTEGFNTVDLKEAKALLAKLS